MTEAGVVKDIASVPARVRQGIEVVVEQDHQPVAVIKSAAAGGRMISEVVATLRARGSNAVMDEDFARDIDEGIRTQREPWYPPEWD